jgi:hypothetical protein
MRQQSFSVGQSIVLLQELAGARIASEKPDIVAEDCGKGSAAILKTGSDRKHASER